MKYRSFKCPWSNSSSSSSSSSGTGANVLDARVDEILYIVISKRPFPVAFCSVVAFNYCACCALYQISDIYWFIYWLYRSRKVGSASSLALCCCVFQMDDFTYVRQQVIVTSHWIPVEVKPVGGQTQHANMSTKDLCIAKNEDATIDL